MRYQLAAILLFYLAFTVAGEAFWWENYKAIPWTAKQLSQNIGGDKYIFVEFYTKSCHFCERLYPKMNKIIDEFTGPKGLRKDMIFVKVDGEKRSSLLDELGVEEYPTMFLFKPGNKKYPDRYVWDHNLEDIRGYLLSFPSAPGYEKKDNRPSSTEKQENSDASKKELEELKKRVKELEAIQKDTDLVTPAIFKDLMEKHKAVVKTSVRRLSRNIKTLKSSTIKIEGADLNERAETATSQTESNSDNKQETEDEEEEDFEYQHAWLVRIICFVLIGVVFAIMLERKKALDFVSKKAN